MLKLRPQRRLQWSREGGGQGEGVVAFHGTPSYVRVWFGGSMKMGGTGSSGYKLLMDI